MSGPRVVFAAANITAEYNDLLLVDTTGGDVTVTLPAASWGLPPVAVKKNSADANHVIVSRSGAALLDGATSMTLANVHQCVTLVPNGANWSASASVAGTAPAATVPDAPTIGTAAAGILSAGVAFTPPASNGGSAITGYTATSSPGGITGTGASSPITVSGLTAGTAYTFTVHATNAVGNSVESAASNSVTPTASATAPGAPTIGTATAGDTTATANWTAPASDGGSAITGYTVKTYNSSGSLLATDTVGVTLSFTKTGLTNGTAVKFKVAATNAIGTGSLSAFSNTVTPAVPFDIVALADHALWRSGSITGLADNDPIATVPDDSGLSHPMTASGSLRAIYKTAILNGHPAMRFTGTQGLAAAANAGQLPISVFVLLIRTSAISGESCIRGAAATGGVEFRHTAGGALHLVMPNIADMATSTSSPLNTLTGINVPKIVGFTYDGSTYAFYDGTTQIGTGSSSHSGSASNTNLGYDTVGGADLFISADVFAHFEAASIVTSGQIADLVAAWQTEFGI